MKRLILSSLFLAGCAPTNRLQSATAPSDTTAPAGINALSGDAAPESLQVKGAEGFTYTRRGVSGQQGLMNRSVRVFFRRDALGYAGPVPLDPVLESTGGRSMTIEGTVRAVEPDWITVEGKNGLIQVIRGESVLLIEVKP